MSVPNPFVNFRSEAVSDVSSEEKEIFTFTIPAMLVSIFVTNQTNGVVKVSLYRTRTVGETVKKTPIAINYELKPFQTFDFLANQGSQGSSNQGTTGSVLYIQSGDTLSAKTDGLTNLITIEPNFIEMNYTEIN